MFRKLFGASLCVLVSVQAWAETPKITVNANPGSLTSPSIGFQKKELQKIAGSVGLVDSKDYKDRYSNNLKDVLQNIPGVFVQPRYGQEVRLSIRGSGVSRGFHMRGLEVLQDGIPVNLADGSGDFYQIDPLSLRSAEVYKGGNGLFFGSSTLGGAINFVTPTAQTATSPFAAQIEGGSFNTQREHLQASKVLGLWDFLGSTTYTKSDGYRQHSDTEASVFNGNAGYQINPDIETRFYTGIYRVDQDLPGAVTLDTALHNPKAAATTALSGDQARVTNVERIANRTSLKTDHGKIDFDTWFIHKDLYHPIFQVIDQDGITYGAGPRYTGDFNLAGFKNELLLGGRFFAGSNKALQFLNINGNRGAQTLDARQDAENYEAYFENRFWFLDNVAFMGGLKAFSSERDYEDKGGLALNPTAKSDEKTYSGLNPKLGLLWQVDPSIQNFINITRSEDVPDFTDLAQTFAATTDFVPLDTQKAWTLEIGSRGSRGRLGWDVAAYRSWIKDELLQFTTGVGIPASTFNAGDTIHQGIELGLSYDVANSLLSNGDNLSVSQLWNYSDFHFEGDEQYGDNRIAGVPKHLLRSSVTYKHRNGFYLTPNLEWAPAGAYADQANTLRVPGYTVLGLKTGVQLENGLNFYIDARNLTNERYVSDIGTVRDATAVPTSIFYPGDGRSVFAGIRYEF